MTKKEVLAEIRRVKRTIRFLSKNQASIIRRGGVESYNALIDFALEELSELKERLKKAKD